MHTDKGKHRQASYSAHSWVLFKKWLVRAEISALAYTILCKTSTDLSSQLQLAEAKHLYYFSAVSGAVLVNLRQFCFATMCWQVRQGGVPWNSCCLKDLALV